MSQKLIKNGLFFTKTLLQWNQLENDRTMPWKNEKDPYKIWLSEIILQQTRVDQGMAYYQKFIHHYPDVFSLSKAKEKDVFKLWEGLGYYNRCRNLLHTAKTIVEDYQGLFPKTYKELLSLKGIGPYTAAAIASFAYQLPHAVVDGNVTRVLSRFFGISTAIDSTEGKLLFNELASSLIDHQSPNIYNQAIMDFGATVCKPKLPLCVQCPMAKNCIAYSINKVSELPIKSKSIIKKERWLYYFVVENKGRLMIRLRSEKDIWQGLNEFFLVESGKSMKPELVLKKTIKEQFSSVQTKVIAVSKCYKQQLTHQTIYAYFIHIVTEKPLLHEGFEFVSTKSIKQLAFPRIFADYFAAAEPFS